MKNNKDDAVKYVAYNEDGEETIVPAEDIKSLSYLPKHFIAFAIGIYLIIYIFCIKCLMLCLTLLYHFLVPEDTAMWQTCVYRPLWITLLSALFPIIIVSIALHISKYFTKKLIKNYKEHRKKSIILYLLKRRKPHPTSIGWGCSMICKSRNPLTLVRGGMRPFTHT